MAVVSSLAVAATVLPSLPVWGAVQAAPLVSVVALDPVDPMPEGEPSAEALALAEAAATGERVEVVEAATETETLWANPEGTLTLEVASSPVRVTNDGGDLVDIDTDLRPSGEGFVPAAVDGEIRLAGDGADSVLVQASPDVVREADDFTVGLGFEGTLGGPTVEGATATYTQDENTSVRVMALEDGFAAHVTLESAPAQGEVPVYRFPLTVDGGITPSLVAGALVFTEESGDVVAASAPLMMWDNQRDDFGEISNARPVDAQLVADGGQQVLELRPSEEFLTDPGTEYPVTIDPDVKVNPSVDTFVTDNDPNGFYSTSSTLRVGSPDGVDRYRSWLNFNVNDQVGRSVTDAKLRLFQYGAGNCNPRQMEVRLATGDWTGSLRTWNTQPTIATSSSRFTTAASFNAGGAVTGMPNCGGAAWQTMDVTPQVSAWAGLQQTRYGFFLMAPSGEELSTGYEKRFCSDDLNTGSTGFCRDPRKPELVITYAPEVGDQGWYSQTSHPLNDRTTLKINHRSGNAHIAANDLQVNSIGMPLNLGRRYNSRSDATGSFGPQWSLNAGPDVWLEKMDEWHYLYHAPDGAELGPFVREDNAPGGSGDYYKFKTPTGGVGAELKDNNNGTFTLTFRKSQNKYVFTQIGSGGHLYQTKQTDRSGNFATFNYVTGTTRLSSVVDTAGRSYTFAYTTAGFIDTITDSNGPSTRVWNYDYANGRLASYTDPDTNTTTYEWFTGTNSTPMVRTITDPLNESEEAPTVVITSEADQAVQTLYEGDEVGSPTVPDSGYAFQYTDQPVSPCPTGADQSAVVISADVKNTYYCLSDRTNGDLTNTDSNATTVVIDGNGDVRKTSFSADNQPEILTGGVAGAGSTVANYGDPANGLGDRLQSMVDPPDGTGAATTTKYKYNAAATIQGNDYLPTSVIDGNGDCTAYAYDSTGRLTDTWIGRAPNTNDRCDNAAGVSGGFHYEVAYNSNGTVAWMTDPNAPSSPTNADKTVYTYWQSGDTGFVTGTVGQVKSVQKPGGDCATTSARKLCTSYTYDGHARTKTVRDGRNNISTYTFDVMDRTTQILNAGASVCNPNSDDCVLYTYDPAGNLVERRDKLGTTDFDYDRLNRQTRQTTPDGVDVTYDYTGDGLVETLTQHIPNQTPDVTTYGYDQGNRLSAVTDAAGSYSFDHDADGRLALTTFPSTPGFSIDSTYTNAGRPKAITVRRGTLDTNALTDYTYDYTKNGNDTDQLQEFVAKNSSAAIDYKSEYNYNSRNQLTQDNRTDGGGAAIASHTYTYDDAGNITSHATAGTTTRYGYDRAGQLCWQGPSTGTSPIATCPTSAPGSNTVVARDAAGNSEGKPSAPLAYNARNQVSSVNGQSQGYLDQGNDLRETTGSTAVINSAFGVTARTTSSGTTYYTRTPDGQLLGSHGAGGTYFYVTDHQGSVMAVVDNTATRAGNYRYTPYGATTVIESTTAAQANPFRWIGAYQTIESGGDYYHLGARYYDTQGHFTQPDPKSGSLAQPLRTNSYLYAGGNPVNLTDPTGLEWWDPRDWEITDVDINGGYWLEGAEWAGSASGTALMGVSVVRFSCMGGVAGCTVGSIASVPIFAGSVIMFGISGYYFYNGTDIDVDY